MKTFLDLWNWPLGIPLVPHKMLTPRINSSACACLQTSSFWSPWIPSLVGCHGAFGGAFVGFQSWGIPKSKPGFQQEYIRNWWTFEIFWDHWYHLDDLMPTFLGNLHMTYPLAMSQIAIGAMAILYSSFTCLKWWLSIAMLVYQRVYDLFIYFRMMMFHSNCLSFLEGGLTNQLASCSLV